MAIFLCRFHFGQSRAQSAPLERKRLPVRPEDCRLQCSGRPTGKRASRSGRRSQREQGRPAGRVGRPLEPAQKWPQLPGPLCIPAPPGTACGPADLGLWRPAKPAHAAQLGPSGKTHWPGARQTRAAILFLLPARQLHHHPGLPLAGPFTLCQIPSAWGGQSARQTRSPLWPAEDPVPGERGASFPASGRPACSGPHAAPR